MKKYISLLLVIMSAILLCGCGEKHDFTSKTFFAMDTLVTLDVEDGREYDMDFFEEYVYECQEIFSKTVTNSEIFLLNQNRNANLSPTALRVLNECLEISKNTDGAFDVCAGALSKLWDVTSDKYSIPDQESIQNAKESCGYENIKVSENKAELLNEKTLVDLGGAVKGFCAGMCLDLMTDRGYKNACISLGGNVAVIGSSQNNLKSCKTGWNVGIKNPDSPDGIIGYVNVTDTTVAVSGDYERYFEKDGKRYHHIFDTSTGYPARSSLRSAAVVCRDGLLADALSTALFVMGCDRAEQLYKSGVYDFDFVLVADDGTVYMTKTLYDVFTPETDAKNKSGISYTYKIIGE